MNVYGGISTYFPSRSAVIPFPFFLLFFFRSRCSPLQKCELYGLSNETPDRYRCVSRDNSFFYHSGTRLLSHGVKHSRPTYSCEVKLFIFLFEDTFAWVFWAGIFIGCLFILVSVENVTVCICIVWNRLVIFFHISTLRYFRSLQPVALKKEKERARSAYRTFCQIVSSYFVCA